MKHTNTRLEIENMKSNIWLQKISHKAYHKTCLRRRLDYKYTMAHTKYKLWIYLYKGQKNSRGKKIFLTKDKTNINKECF